MNDVNAVIAQLRQSPEASVQYKLRVNVLGEDAGSKPIKQLREQVRQSPRVRSLLQNRDARGHLRSHGHIYDKWQGAHWIFATLADIGYPPGDRSLQPAADDVIDCWLGERFYVEFESQSKTDVYKRDGVPVICGRHRRCASQQGNALWSLLKLKLIDQKRAAKLVERLLHWQWRDGGWNCDKDPTADTSSFMETMLPMRGLTLYARETGDKPARDASLRAAEVLLCRKLFKRRSNGSIINREFVLLHYPLYWHYDILAGLKVLTEMDLIAHARCNDALDLLEQKQLPDGGWPAQRRYYTKVGKAQALGTDYVDWGGTSARKMNPWVTVDALAVLRAADRIRI